MRSYQLRLKVSSSAPFFPMQQATLCFLVNQEEQKILLGMKKRRFGAGKYNGLGGKPDGDESIEEAAVRELREEASVDVALESLYKVAELTFYFSQKPEWNQVVHVYLIYQWEGTPQESEEMRPEWFRFTDIPYDRMWKDDSYWLPLIIQGKKVKGTFTFGEDNESILTYELQEQ